MKHKIAINHLLPGMYLGGAEVGIKKNYKDINKYFNSNFLHKKTRNY